MRRVLALVLLVAMSMALTPAAHANDTDPGPLLVVFDTSGSMDDKGPDGTVKLSAAKTSMRDMIYSMAGSSQDLGLWTYPGGASVGGCPAGQWVTNLSPDQSPDATDVQAEIGLLTASGGTPTGPALRAVVESLKQKQIDRATIVLVSDGEANCGPPACEVAKVVNSGFALTVAAVAFDIADNSGRADLECAASITGGSYSTADNTAQLIEELAEYQHKDLELEVDIPTTVRAGEVMQVTATVTNPSPNTVRGASLLLAFDDLSITSHIPAPQRRLPALEPGASLTRTWVVPTRSNVSGERSWRVLAGSETRSVLKAGTITFTDQPLTRLDGGELLDGYGGNVLILGDSYSSGEGTADYVLGDYESPDGKIRCHRSKSAYGGVIGGAAASILACSGAVSWELGYKKVGTTDQLSMLVMAAKPDVVFLTIGGNDIGFAGIVEQCFLGDCSADEVGHLGRIAVHKGWAETYQRIAAIVNQPDRLKHRDGTPVPVIVSPYPDPLWEVTRGRCNAGAGIEDWFRNGVSLGTIRMIKGKEATDIGFSSRDIATGKRVLAELNAKVEESVAEARANGYPVYYAATTSDFALGHSICEDDSYFVRLDPKSSVWRALPGTASLNEVFHPNKAGHRAWADALITWSQSVKADPVLKGQALGPVSKPFVPLFWRPKADVSPDLKPLERPELQYPQADSISWLVPGSSVNIEVNGLAPGSNVLVTVRSEPIALGQIAVGEDGVGSGAVTLPDAFTSGSHELIIEGYDENFRLVGTVVKFQVWSGISWPLAGAMVLCWASGLIALITWAVAKARRRAVRGGGHHE